MSTEHPQGLRLGPGYHSVNPYFLVDGVAGFIEFLVDVFDSREDTTFKEVLADGRIDHADVHIGDSIVMMSEGNLPPRPSVAFVFVPDVDECYRRAMARGCTSRREPGTVPWGDRVAGFADPWDNRRWVATPGASYGPLRRFTQLRTALRGTTRPGSRPRGCEAPRHVSGGGNAFVRM